MTLLWITDAHALHEDALFDVCLQKVSAERQHKVARAIKEKDRLLSLAGGLLLEAAQQKMPHCNLSHSGRYAVCAGGTAPVGVDVEAQRDDVRTEPFARRFFSPSEQDYLFSFAAEADRKEAFFRLWVLKESFLKAVGVGLQYPLPRFSLQVGNRVTVSQNIDAHTYTFHEYRVEAYHIALCTRDAAPAPPLLWAEIKRDGSLLLQKDR